MVFTRALIGLVFVGSSVAFAVGSSVTSSPSGTPPHKCELLREPDARVLTAPEMSCRVTDIMDRFGIFQVVDWMALALVMIFFVSRLLSASASMQGGRKVWPIALSSGFALSMLFMLPELRGGLSLLFQQSHSLAAYASEIVYADNKADLDAVLAEVDAFSSMVVQVCVAAAIEISEDSGLSATLSPDDAVPVGLAGLSLEDAIILSSSGPGDEVVLQNAVFELIGWFLKREFKARIVPFIMDMSTAMVNLLAKSLVVLADTILLPIAALNHMVNFGGSLVMIVGSLTLPVGLVMIVAGQGLGFLVNWVKVIVAALITLMVFPTVWTIGVNLAVISPVRTALVSLNDAYSTWLTASNEEEVRQMLNAVLSALGAVSVMVINALIGLILAMGIAALIGRIVISFLSGAEMALHRFGSASGGSFDPLLPDKGDKGDDDKKESKSKS